MAFPEEMRSAFGSFGPDWDRAVDMGIDVSLLVENLKLTPAERLARLEGLLNELELLRASVKVVELRRDPVP